jgi:hypothetical protein
MRVFFLGRRKMMKKLLVLLILVGLTAMASAALQISVNGEKNPLDSEIWVDPVPSGMLVLDIWTDARIAAGLNEVPGWQLIVLIDKASIYGGVSKYPTEPGVTIYDDIGGMGYAAEPGHNGVWGMIAITGVIPEITAGSVIYDEINFHCEAPGDAIVKLYVGDWVTWTLADSVVIHQPEPMTVALLGLGGLFLRRRK